MRFSRAPPPAPPAPARSHVHDGIHLLRVVPLARAGGGDVGLVLVIGHQQVDLLAQHLAAEIGDGHLGGSGAALAGDVGVDAAHVQDQAEPDDIVGDGGGLGQRGQGGDGGQRQGGAQAGERPARDRGRTELRLGLHGRVSSWVPGVVGLRMAPGADCCGALLFIRSCVSAAGQQVELHPYLAERKLQPRVIHHVVVDAGVAAQFGHRRDTGICSASADSCPASITLSTWRACVRRAP